MGKTVIRFWWPFLISGLYIETRLSTFFWAPLKPAKGEYYARFIHILFMSPIGNIQRDEYSGNFIHSAKNIWAKPEGHKEGLSPGTLKRAVDTGGPEAH